MHAKHNELDCFLTQRVPDRFPQTERSTPTKSQGWCLNCFERGETEV